MKKNIYFNTDARNKLLKGVNEVGDAVKVTLGAKGRYVLIDKQYESPHPTKDGATVAKEIELEDPVENVGAQMIKETTLKTAEIAGDGSSTSTILAQSMVNQGFKNVAAGANPMDLKRGIDKAVTEVVAHLRLQSNEIGNSNDRIAQVASISANNDEVIGSLIAQAVKEVGNNGVITVDEAKGTETTVEVVQGMSFDRGCMSPYYITDDTKEVSEMTNAFIIITDKRIEKMTELMPILEGIHQAGQSVLIIADDFSPEVLTTLITNRTQGRLNVVTVKAPHFGDKRTHALEDIAIATGGQVITVDKGLRLEEMTAEMLGQADKVTIGKNSTIIVNGNGRPEAIQSRITLIQTQLGSDPTEGEKETLEERLAKLSGGVAVLSVGAATEVEMKEKKDRVDDALAATRAAIEEGIVPGGGVALIRALDALSDLKGVNEDETTGIAIVRRAIEEPLRQMIENCGNEGAVIVQKVKEGKRDFGYNVRTETFENLYSAGVIDPTKVTRVALENAASVASMLLTTECVIVDIP